MALNKEHTQGELHSYHELVISERARARKLAHHILNHWNATLDRDEFESVVDLALCEAARNFKPQHDVKFSTYLFYFLKGALIRSIAFSKKDRCIPLDKEEHEQRSLLPAHELEEAAARQGYSFSSDGLTEKNVYLDELRQYCEKALRGLSELERTVVFRVHVLDFKLARVARDLGYSRGHISELRTKAFRKVREEMGFLRQELWLQAA